MKVNKTVGQGVHERFVILVRSGAEEGESQVASSCCRTMACAGIATRLCQDRDNISRKIDYLVIVG